jgi:hypothetical protein
MADDKVEHFMQSLLSKIPKAAAAASTDQKQKPLKQSTSTSQSTSKSSKSTKPEDKKQEQKESITGDLDLKEIDLITKRLAQDLNTASFLSEDEDEEDNEDNFSEEEDDEEFRKQILQEFSNVMNKNANAEGKVSKQTLKILYLQLLSQGPSLLSSQDEADKFISKLSANEVSALTDLLQKSPDDIIQFFNGDEMVKRAIENQNVINLSRSDNTRDELRKDLWKDLTSADLEELNETDTQRDTQKDIPIAVREAIKTFEANVLHYSQHPAALLQLCEKLSAQDQNIFLDILYREYTPDKMNKLIKDSTKEQTQPQADSSAQQPPFKFDSDLVAHVFKEVLTHFRAFKKHPEKFDPLLNKLNEQERMAFDSLVKVFWDLKLEQIKL